MKYYSEELKKVFDTEKDLVKAEEQFALEKQEKEAKLAVKKEKAVKVEDAYKHIVEVRKEAEKKIKEAEEEYFKLRNEFIKEYGSWHFTYTDADDSYYFSDAFETANNLLKEFFGW